MLDLLRAGNTEEGNQAAKFETSTGRTLMAEEVVTDIRSQRSTNPFDRSYYHLNKDKGSALAP